MSIHLGDLPTWIAALGGTGAAAAALRQMTLQRRQLANQQQALEAETERNRKRDELLTRQLRDFDQRARTWQRRQAEKITVDFTSTTTPPPNVTVKEGDSVHAVMVINDSDRPIRDVAALITINDSDSQRASQQRWYNPATEPATGDYGVTKTTGYDRADLMKVGDRVEFAFVWSTSTPGSRLTAQFTDDTGLRWQIDQNLHLQPVEH
jgi:hypothetical protein